MHLEKNGLVILEIGIDQADDIRKLAIDAGFSDIRFMKDYAGIERIFVGKYHKIFATQYLSLKDLI